MPSSPAALSDATTDSLRLRAIATTAFHDHVLPAIHRDMPEVADRIVVTITSSVAYGTADRHSDLDVFVVFRREQDYRRYATALQKLIDGLNLGTVYGAVCDKGVRFELESLARSDLSRLFHHPEKTDNWHRQTEWLLFWFLESVPIHDPGGIHARLKGRAGRWPAPVLASRHEAARTRVATWTHTAQRELAATGYTYTALRAACYAATAALDLAYLTAGRYGPHPKWRHPHADRLLAEHPRALTALENMNRLARALIDLPDSPRAFGAALAEHQAEQAPPDTAATRPWAEALTAAAHRFADQHGVIWVAHDRSPGTRFLTAARTAAAAGEAVYLAEELGGDLLQRPGRSYDQALRIAAPLRWLAGSAPESQAVTRRRWLYLNFVIWRKLRVVAKARRRGHPFTCRWYQLQVIDHLTEARALLAGGQPPPLHRYTRQALSLLSPPWSDLLTTDAILGRLRDLDGYLMWAWGELEDVQQRLVARQLLPAAAVTDPLATQWDVQYWRYENLFV
ncbi:nucleotidyltransferase family protein [Peterkaempfera bronchialis]|uniref:Uncharacterized protein n=1 Tax=Peterkaempfera bronchialis TaxID=2126346 RepID=A0A345SUA2_9ACTN|nr:nucleotidyltransferase domain-containing protein [Peterkaempfera bronchialis]AXI77307.1 hypothetical protein C7M71_007470 [Peterkaempfera bronchialis]